MKLTFSLCLALASAAAPALAIPVSVTVVGPDDKPLVGAELNSFETKTFFDPKAEFIERTGVAGVFAWNWNGDFADKRPAGEKPFLYVRAQAPGLAPQFQAIRQGQTIIKLQATRNWSGLVFDVNQKPVAGAKITLENVSSALEKPKAGDELLGAFIPVDDKIAVTDAQGRWVLAGVPTQGRAQVTVSAPNFAGQRVSLIISEGDAAPIYLKQSGAITGRLLAPDGSPIVGEKILATNGVMNQTVTDAQGRFTLENIEPGRATFLIGDVFGSDNSKAAPSYIVSRFQRANVEAGKTIDVGEIKAQKGLILKARVVGADTKLPLLDARFRIGYNLVTNAINADGTLQSRVVPPKENRGFDVPKIESKGYVDYELPVATLQTQEETLDLGTIEMKRGNTIQGNVRIEGADGVVRAPGISFSRDNKYDFVSVKADNSFESKTLEAGSYRVNLNGGNGDWQIVSPRTVAVPEAGVEFKPIEVVVKRLTTVLPTIKSANGRIVDENGQGVAGVVVRANMPMESGFTSNKTATTDKDGAFRFDGDERVVGVEITGAEHPSFLISGKATVEVKDNIATISGLIAKKRGAVYRSHVVGADGKAAVGAWVAVVEARDYEPVQTDANGDFALADVPLDKFTLIAAQGRDWTKQSAQSDKAGATLKLQAAGAPIDRAQAIDTLLALKEGVPSDTLFASWDILGAEVTERYIRRNGEPRPEIMAMYAMELARRDPSQLLQRAPELLGNATGETRENLVAQIALVRAASDDAGARTDANAWLDEQKQIRREIKPRSVTQLLQMAVVAQKLEREDASQWIDYAAAMAAQIKGKAEDNAFAWGGILSRLNYNDVTRFVEGRGAADEFQILAYVTPLWAKTGDVPSAQSGLKRLEALLATPEIAQLAEQASKQRRIPPMGTVEAARSAIAVALAPTDPQAAWAMAQKIEDTYRRARAMVRVADQAQRAGNAEIAEKALRDVINTPLGNIEYYALAASIGARVRPQLGDELFAFAKKAALPTDKTSSFGPPSIGLWAFYHAPFDAAQSRVLIEREWDWRLPAAIKSKNDSFSSDYSALPDLIKGMATVDLKRATEMQAAVDAIETKNYGRTISAFNLALLQLATPQQRAGLGVDLSMNY